VGEGGERLAVEGGKRLVVEGGERFAVERGEMWNLHNKVALLFGTHLKSCHFDRK